MFKRVGKMYILLQEWILNSVLTQKFLSAVTVTNVCWHPSTII